MISGAMLWLSPDEVRLAAEAIEIYLQTEGWLSDKEEEILRTLKERLEDGQSQQESLRPGNLPTQSQ